MTTRRSFWKILLSKEEKEKQQYKCEQYKNLLEDKKQSSLCIEKNIKWEKTLYIIMIRKFLDLENFPSS